MKTRNAQRNILKMIYGKIRINHCKWIRTTKKLIMQQAQQKITTALTAKEITRNL